MAPPCLAATTQVPSKGTVAPLGNFYTVNPASGQRNGTRRVARSCPSLFGSHGSQGPNVGAIGIVMLLLHYHSIPSVSGSDSSFNSVGFDRMSVSASDKNFKKLPVPPVCCPPKGMGKGTIFMGKLILIPELGPFYRLAGSLLVHTDDDPDALIARRDTLL